jgi:hypothetical protein
MFKYDLFDGEGTYIWANGCSFQGNFLKGKMHGTGTYKWPDGTSYRGEYVENLKHGFGKFEKSDGKIIEGEFVYGKLQEYKQSRTSIPKKIRDTEKFLNINLNLDKTAYPNSNKDKTVTSITLSNPIKSQRTSQSTNSTRR